MSVFDRASSGLGRESLDASAAFRELAYRGVQPHEAQHDSHKFVQHMQETVRRQHGCLPEIQWKGDDWYMQTEYHANEYCVPYLVDGKPVKDCHPYR